MSAALPSSGESGRTFPTAGWRLVILVALAVGLAGALWTVLPPSLLPPERLGAPDSVSYYATADGRHAEAYSYYAGRVLHPVLVGRVAGTFALPLPNAFRLTHAVSLGVFFGAVALLVRRYWILPLLLSAVVFGASRDYYVADLFYAAMTAVFLLLSSVSPWLGLAMVPLLHLTRESTVMVALIVAAVNLRRDRRLAVVALGLGVVGVAVVGWLAAQGVPSRHGLPMVLFNGAKVAFNAASNLLGLMLWTDTNAVTLDCQPLWKTAVQIGGIREVGLCTAFYRPVSIAADFATAFGVLPLLLWRRRAELWGAEATRLACWLGVSAAVMAPLVGTSVGRYLLQAWPLCWVWGAAAVDALSPRRRAALVGLSLVASWTPRVMGLYPAVPVLLLLYWLTSRVVGTDPGAPPTTDHATAVTG